MNDYQLAQQIKYLLEKIVWPTPVSGFEVGDLVFGAKGRVTVFAGTPTQEQIPKVFPAAMVLIGTGVPDEEAPELVKQEFTVIGAVSVMGDPMGQQAIIGGPAADLGKSAGKGIAEINTQVRNAIKNLTTMDGAKILMSQVSIDVPAVIAGRHLVIAEISVEALCTTDLHYSAPQELSKSVNTWTWKGATHCRGRFDFKQYRLGYLTGLTPPATAADATMVESPVTTETITHSALSGKTYSIFADYSARKQASGEHQIEGSSAGNEVGAYV